VADVVGRTNPVLVALDRTSGALLPWNPLNGVTLAPYGANPLAILDDEVFLGHQSYYSGAGQVLFYRASLNGPNWAPGPIATIGYTMDAVSGGGRLVLTGSFRDMGNVATSCVAVLVSPTVGVPKSLERASLGDLHVWPDPASDRVAFRWRGAAAPTRLDILDVSGRRVRMLSVTREQVGPVEWDLRREDGSRASAGVHFAIVTARDGTRSMARFVVLK
jgi:hypothetical protein